MIMTPARTAPLRPTQGPENVEQGSLADECVSFEGPSDVIACAFYTDNYLPQVHALRHSLKSHKLRFFLKRVARQSTWEATTRLKAAFVRDCLARFTNSHILYLDADSVLRKNPDFLATVKTDVAFCVFNKPIRGKHCLQLSGGTIYVRNTEGGRRFAHEWAETAQHCGQFATDEDMIHMAFGRLEGLTLTVLPMAFYKVFDNKRAQEPIVEHFQASRSQFKISKAVRRVKRVSVAVGIVSLLTFAGILLTRA